VVLVLVVAENSGSCTARPVRFAPPDDDAAGAAPGRADGAAAGRALGGGIASAGRLRITAGERVPGALDDRELASEDLELGIERSERCGSDLASLTGHRRLRRASTTRRR
jgi:hypothetical protein